jgi:peroxiredoxin
VRPMPRWIGSCFALLVILMLVACFEASQIDGDLSKSTAPDFDLVQLDGHPIRLADMAGKIVILDFWATWCRPCEDQMPVLDALWQDREWREKHADDLMIVGISVDSDPAERVAKWIAERGFEYPIAIADLDLAMRYGVFGFPTLVVIDQSGGIYTRHTGVWSRPEIERVLDQIRLEVPVRS